MEKKKKINSKCVIKYDGSIKSLKLIKNMIKDYPEFAADFYLMEKKTEYLYLKKLYYIGEIESWQFIRCDLNKFVIFDIDAEFFQFFATTKKWINKNYIITK